ncbi:TPA: TolC family protein [Escherichia coli]
MDNYFNKTKIFSSYSLDQEQNKVEESNNITSLLPRMSMGMGQYINNKKRLSTFGDSNVYFSLSQDVFAAYKYKNNKDKLAIQKSLQDLELQRKKYEYLLNFYYDNINYLYKLEQIELTKNQIKKLETDYNMSKVLFNMGKIPHLDTEIKRNNLDKMKNTLNEVEMERQYTLMKINSDYAVPEKLLHEISLTDIKSCKRSSIMELVRDIYRKKNESVEIDNKISESSLLPSLYVSVGLTPKNGGTLSDISLREMDYNASISIDIPLSDFFSSSNSKKTNAMNLVRNGIDNLSDFRGIELLRFDISNKLHIMKKKNSMLKKGLYIKWKELSYISERVKNKKESVLAYYSLQDDIYDTELEIKRSENELMYYELYLYFLG